MSEEKRNSIYDGEDEYDEFVKAHEELLKKIDEWEKNAKTSHSEKENSHAK